MTHVLVLADDECIRFTCAEVLSQRGFRATTGAPPFGSREPGPDVVLLWEPCAAAVETARLRYAGAALVVCTYGSPCLPPGATPAPLPFNAERVATAVCAAARRSFRAAA
jgi:hypothetical protein